MKDARFFWALLVPRLDDAHEWFTLSPEHQLRLHLETMQVALALKNVARADKINIGALGNVVAQLHVHVLARSQNDACWPGPVWGTAVEAASDALIQSRSAVLLAELNKMSGRNLSIN
jgi:diadenosine tetraphosphate (Ap4A) HIT family hydrolase